MLVDNLAVGAMKPDSERGGALGAAVNENGGEPAPRAVKEGRRDRGGAGEGIAGGAGGKLPETGGGINRMSLPAGAAGEDDHFSGEILARSGQWFG
jgi:hypothetical protein